MYVSITNTKGVMGILMISWSGGCHIGFFWKLRRGLVPLEHLATSMVIESKYWNFFKCHWTKVCTPSGKCCLRPLWTVADRGVPGPWGPQFCVALYNGETQRLPTGIALSPPAGSGAEPRRQTPFGNNIQKIGWKSDILVAVYTHNSDLISDVVAYGKLGYPSRLYYICHLSGKPKSYNYNV